MKTRTVIRILSHGSLSHNRKNEYVKFHVWEDQEKIQFSVSFCPLFSSNQIFGILFVSILYSLNTCLSISAH